MTVATQRTSTTGRMTLEAFLSYDDGTDDRYELVNGILVEMRNEAKINTLIAGFLFSVFLKLGLPSHRIGFKQKLEVQSQSAKSQQIKSQQAKRQQTKRQHTSARDPDLLIHSEESAAAGNDASQFCLKLNEPNPLIVIEVVSPGEPGTPNYDRDYKQKPVEYASRGIPEYWVIDPSPDRAWVKVGTWVNGPYEFQTFTGQDPILSLSFPVLDLTANQILTAGR